MMIVRTGGRRLAIAGWMLAAMAATVAAPAGIARAQEAAEQVVGQQLTISRDDETVTIRQADRVLLRYRFDGVPHKPYVQELTTPGGANILRDAPADHLHHHGLMFACRANSVNFWEETAGSGKQVHLQWRALRIATVGQGAGGAPAEVAVLRERLAWQGPDQQTLLEEDRTLTIPADQPGQPRLLTWQSTFTAPVTSAAVTLTGTAYNGLGMRFPVEMDKGGLFQNAMAGRGVADTNNRQAAWCAYTASPGPDKPVTVAAFDARDNLRHPTRWFTMDTPFAYLAASLGVDTEPITIAPGNRLTLRYGVAVFDGAANAEAIAAAHSRWQQAPAEVRVGSRPGLIGRYVADRGGDQAEISRIDPNVAFDWSDGMPDDRLPKGPFSAEWDGELFVDADGEYRFFAEASGAASVWVDDRQVAGAGLTAELPVTLEYGFHPLRVTYRSAAAPRMKLLWQYQQHPREVINPRYLAHGGDSAGGADAARFASHERGRELVTESGCAHCHPITGLADAPRPGPPLNRVAQMGPEYLRRWLSDPQAVRAGTVMPTFHRGRAAQAQEEVMQAAVLAFLRSLPLDAATQQQLDAKNLYRQRSATELPSGSFAGGRDLFHKLGCVACHSPEDPSNAEPAEAPSLADVGAKWPRGTLLRFLEDPLLWHPRGRMPDFKLTELEAADLAAYLATFRKLGSGEELSDPETQALPTTLAVSAEQIAMGKHLVERHGCAACHEIPGVAPPETNAPPLDRYAADPLARGCLRREPHQRRAMGPIPQFAVSPEDRAAAAAFLADRPVQPSQVATQEVALRSLYNRYLCNHCHDRDGTGEDHLSRALMRYAGEADRPSAKAAATSPPELSGIGAKLRGDWIQQVLNGAAPSPRPWLSLRMPRFALNDQERLALVHGFVAADGVALEPTPAAPAVSAALAAAATTLLGPRGFSCANCHYLGRHQAPADTVGPDLVFASQRISREWFLRWLENPARVRPGTPMPAIVLPVPNVAQGDLALQKEILWHYLSNTPADRIVLEAEPSRLVATAGPRPAIVQGRVLGAAPLRAPRAVAIGLANGHSLLFDGGRLAWLGHWMGDFVREHGLHGAHHHWLPAGEVRWQTEQPLPPVLFRNKSTGDWLTAAVWRDRFGWFDEVQYTGRGVRISYRLRLPEMIAGDGQDGPWLTVNEWLDPNPPGIGEDGYTRRLRIEGLPPQYDAVAPLPLGSGAQPAVVVGPSNNRAETEPLVISAASGPRTVVARVSSSSAVRWVESAPATLTQPVLQPFSDEPLTADQRFDPVTLTVPKSLAAVSLANAGDGQTQPLELLMQVIVQPADQPIAVGPPRTWPANQEPDRAQLAASVPVTGPVKPGELSESSGFTATPGFQVQRLPLPPDYLVCALDFWRGHLLVGGYDGEIRLAEDSDGDGLPDRYRHFAGLLDQVNNLRVFGDAVFVTTPGGVYELRDRDGDLLADSYRLASSTWDWSGHPFDWTLGLTRDAEGNLYCSTTTPHERGNVPGLFQRGSVLKIRPDGHTQQIGVGTRYNFGWAQNHAGRMYFNVNQGHWNITCGIHEVVAGSHYGFGEPDASQVLPPVVRVPYPWCRSLTGMVFAEERAAFGPFQGQAFAADYNTRRIIRWSDDTVGAVRQGFCLPFVDGLDAGPTELTFGPDGAMYVGFMSDASWYPERPRGGIYKVSFTGPLPFAIRSGRVTATGLAIDFTAPVDPASVVDPAAARVHRYFHEYKGVYHSEEIAHEDVAVPGVELSADRLTLAITTAPHVWPRIYRLHLRGVRSVDGAPLANGEMFFTVHAVPEPASTGDK